MMKRDTFQGVTAGPFKRFPPRWGHILIPVGSQAGALAGITLYPACARKAVWFQRTAYEWVKHFGAGSLPWRGESWSSPMDDEVWVELCARWRDLVGDFDTFVVSDRRPTTRPGFMVLLVRGETPIGFVKVRQDREGLETEFAALKMVMKFRPKGFLIPEPLGISKVENWAYLVMTPLETCLHSMPRNPPVERITDEISSALKYLPKPEGTPVHWRPMHGDFTPWNLRCAEGQLVLVDWEYASWAPPGADEVLYYAVLSMITAEESSPPAEPEAVEFWKRITSERQASHRDALVASLEARISSGMADRASHLVTGTSNIRRQ